MASAISPLLQTLSHGRVRNAPLISCKAQASNSAPIRRTTTVPSGRRQLLSLIAASTALTAIERSSNAVDIPLFGLRKKLRNAEEEAEEIVKEGFEAAEKGIETVEKGIVTAEEGIETAEKGIETILSFGGLAQAGVVAGAELVGVVIATSIVNAILGPDAQKSKS